MEEEAEGKKVVKEEKIKKDEFLEDQKISQNETTEEFIEKLKIKKEIIGIKLPSWLGYTLLTVIISLFIFLDYKIFSSNLSREVSSEIDNSLFTIKCDKGEIVVGEIIHIDINKYNENVVLQSSNPEIITTNNNSILGVAEGNATIFAVHGEERSNEIIIKCIINLEEITLNKNSLEIQVGSQENLEAIIVPENATYKDVIWKSSDETIATVENGNIKAIKEGQVTITVSDKLETKNASCIVTVKPIEVKSISLDENYVKIGVGQAYILRSTVNPNNATYQDITWSTSNPEIISVDNGNIKAITIGEATVTASSKNGKIASCTFCVSDKAPTNEIKYATDSFNVRNGPGTSYKLLGSVSRNDEIEILKEQKNWTKLRLNNGIVGYTISKAYSSTKAYYIEGVPYINQFDLGYPTGCEAVSATMAANYSGYNVSVATIIANTPTDTLGKREEIITKEVQTELLNEITGEMEIVTTTQEETVWVGGNPFQVFVGHPTMGLSKGSYGCFAAPIVTALNNSGVPCSSISGSSIDTVFSYIQQGKPVVVWCKKNAGDLIEGVTWKYSDGSGEFIELIGEHCAVLIGYDGDYVYLNDPSAGKSVKQPRGKFTSNWYKLYSQAIVIN